MTSSQLTTEGLAEVTVLVVEDSDDDALFLRKNLEQGIEYAFVNDIEIERESSLSAAIDACNQRTFDAVFLDLGLPDSNGIETLRRFSDAEFDVPIIVQTGLRDRETALEAIRQGAQEYLVKGESGPETIVKSMRHAIERSKNERQLRRHRDQMEFFNSILRHDMLNGMQIIRGNVYGLADELDGEPGEKAETILEWSDNIVDLTEKIRDILDTLTSEDTTELQRFVVDDVMADLVAEIEGIREGVTVTVDCDDDAAVQANELFVDVLRNLLINAVKHTEPEPVDIEVTAERDGDTVEIVVADDGPGVDDARKERIFERGETSGSAGGSGFGLYFVDSIVETYGGSVTVEDNEPQGAQFILTLPNARAESVLPAGD
ncbi:hybrid sensor histidine kinase/response regulator [Halonotius roseus]|uniref:Response regulator n=1 Tax=Halonotius roseus TaxID=2511997 RepID=A0A544QM01_9EURY|nr:hybrid sensor histidine kinase/response regulator [Halonotius roseus]TQQ79637.1 response regulator [Halonotius roseus]